MKTKNSALELTSDVRLGEAVSLVIFDMDGVIADTAEGHKVAWREYLAGFGKPFTDEDFKAIFGTGNKELCPILFPERDFTDDEIQTIGDEKEALFRKKAKGLLTTYAGFFEFLDYCDSKGVAMAVGSSACRANVEFVLDELDITHRFTAIVSADDVENAKPEPDIFLKAASDAGVEEAKALVLEDSSMGIEAAKKAGMKVAALTTTHREQELPPATLYADDFRELTEKLS